MKRHALSLLMTAGLAGVAGLAHAHAHLQDSIPPAEAALTAAPSTVSASYSEPIELALSGLVVEDEQGIAVETGDPYHPDDDRQSLAVDVPELAPGTYTVEWGVVSIDTHRTEGSFRFTIDTP